jgi:hypothetical protein
MRPVACVVVPRSEELANENAPVAVRLRRTSSRGAAPATTNGDWKTTSRSTAARP